MKAASLPENKYFLDMPFQLEQQREINMIEMCFSEPKTLSKI